MSQREDKSDGHKFVRNSKLRQSVRIKNRSKQLPPSALIYMKHLEKNQIKEPAQVTTSTEKINRHEKFTSDSQSIDIIDFDDISNEDAPLISGRMNSKRLSKKGIAKKSSGKKHKSLSRFLSFFR